jgi:integrase
MTHPPTSPVLDSTPSHAALTASDAERIATAIEAELAPSTRQLYAGAWRQWERWCHGRGLNALPASPEALAAFLTERAEAGLTFGTLDGYCSGIARRHHQEGLPDPTADFVVRRVRRGLRRIMGVAPRRQAHPLTVTEIAQILKRIDTSAPIGIRDRAVILLGYASAMRPGEVSALDVGDTSPSPPASSSMSAAPRPIRTLAVSSSVSLAATIDLPTRSGRSTTGSASAQLDRARSSPA